MLKTGLNIQKKTKAASSLALPQKRPSAFGDASEDDNDDDTAAALPSRPPRGQLPSSSLKKPTLDEDDAAYDYDAVYDAMKVHDRAAAVSKQQDKRDRKPKYMQDLLHMAEVRKRDRLQAEDVKLQRERAAEGDLFDAGEQFVTGAYKAQQETLQAKRREEEEKEAALRRQAGGMTAFNQTITANDRRKHEAAVEASLHAKRGSASGDTDAKIETEADKARQAEAKLGHAVAVNDNNEIVDHRQLLAAGLNRSAKTSTLSHRQEHAGPQTGGAVMTARERDQRRAQLARQERAVADQIAEARRQEQEAQEAKLAAVQQQAKRTKTDADITSAKDRYLARKKAEAEAKALANGPS